MFGNISSPFGSAIQEAVPSVVEAAIAPSAGENAGQAVLQSLEQTAEQALMSRVAGLIGGASPKVQQIAGAGLTLAESIAQHPQPKAHAAAIANFALSFLPTSFKF